MRLTERSGRGISLTAAASILVAHTDAVLTQLGAAEADLAALRDEVVGRVTLAAFPSAAAGIVPGAWAALARSAPHVEIDLTEMEPEESLPAVLRGEVDVAIAHEYDVLPRPLDPLFERRELLSDPVLVAVPAEGAAAFGAAASGPLATSEDGRVLLRSLAELPFLVPRAGTSCAEMVQRACARAGFVPRVAARAGDFHVLLRLAGAGAGVALVPRLAARDVPPGVRLVEPAEPVTRQVFTVSRRGGDRKPAARVALDALAAQAAMRPAAA